ncbi:hypothetical protein NMY22_g4345 [Coprinellus aureogranulatus]|nr:hypothetical protein NMY22_g4345 [Coprinellus aureogranulatus]
MSAAAPAYAPLDGEDLEAGQRASLTSQPVPTRSIYTLTRGEIMRGVANRFVHSRAYILLYLVMAALSVTTIVLSLTDGCPGPAFYILEVIINTSMILEVSIRLVALGRQFWRSPFNVVDLILTVFCALTLLVLAFAKCGAGSKEEEIFDTLLLIARNVLQFGRLAAVMRQSGQSIFSRPKPIDINAARRAGFGMELDVESDDEDDAELNRPLVRNPILFDAEDTPTPAAVPARPMSDMPRAAQAVRDRDVEDMWAELG